MPSVVSHEYCVESGFGVQFTDDLQMHCWPLLELPARGYGDGPHSSLISLARCAHIADDPWSSVGR